jgi:hypothetical protein
MKPWKKRPNSYDGNWEIGFDESAAFHNWVVLVRELVEVSRRPSAS